MSLRLRLALIASGLAFLGLLLGLGSASFLLSYLTLAQVDRTLHLQARALLEEALADAARQVPPEAEQEILGSDFPGSAWLYQGGRLVWAGGLPSPPGLAPAAGFRPGPTTVAGWRVYALVRPPYRVVVAQPLGVVEGLTGLYLRLGLPLLLLVSLLTGFGAYLLLGPALAPLRRLAEAASRFQPVPALEGEDEVAHLAQALARLLRSLEEERAGEKAFLALASHELKTPIAALRIGLDHLLQAKRPEREALLRLRNQAERLEALAENLLALSRAEAQDLRLSALDLGEVAALVFDRFQPVAVTQGRELLLERSPAWVVADERLLERALNNLVQNALLHGQGRITLRVGWKGERPFVEVADQGPGPGPRAREGLGLRVVHRVAQALGAEIWLGREGGFRVLLLFRSGSALPPLMGPGAEAPEVRG